MKKVKTVLATSAAAAAIALGSTPAMAELEASAAVSNIYLFRGVDQGSGSGAVSGDLVYSHDSGLYGGIWASSAAGFKNGGEIDTFAGWSGSFGDLGVDIGVLDYYYPGANGAADDWGKGLTEAYLGLSFAGVEFYYYDQISGKSTALDDNTYMSLSYGMDKFSAVLGMADFEEAQGQTFDNDYMHLDLSYAFNDNLSFTLTKVVDKDDELTMEDDVQVVVSYSIPLM
ncbi:TorF family putative porin [Litorivivens sp.]|uniref:TorF family putative porin n=1 Tax=Litorivivens sp. TaxID=2020868 RepID=UPI00356ACBCD